MANNPGFDTAPYSEEAEEAVLGSLLTLPRMYDAVAPILIADDFYILRHRYIYEAIERIAKRGEEWDYLTVSNELLAMQRLQEVGGAGYLLRLVNNTPTSVHAGVYANIVRRAAVRCRLLEFGDEVKALALSDETNAENLIAEVESRLMRVAPDQLQKSMVRLSDAISQAYDQIEAAVNGSQELTGLPTGFTHLDSILRGAKPGNLIYIGGRPGMGKSAWLACVALYLAKAGKRVVWWSGEMGELELALRFISMNVGIPTNRLSAGQIDLEVEWPRAQEGMGRLKNLQIWFETTPGITPTALRAKLLAHKREFGIDMLIIDYIGLMKAPDAGSRVQEVGSISRALKEMAREFNIPVYSAAQLNRKCEDREDKRPRLSDLKESGDLEQDADVVVFLYRDEVYNEATESPNAAEVIIAKHRAGPTGAITLYFDKGITTFRNAATRAIDFSRHEPLENFE